MWCLRSAGEISKSRIPLGSNGAAVGVVVHPSYLRHGFKERSEVSERWVKFSGGMRHRGHGSHWFDGVLAGGPQDGGYAQAK
jgi:hypothetical protein